MIYYLAMKMVIEYIFEVKTKDIPYYTIIGGIPAKVIRKRFGDNIILKLLKIKRWDWPVEKSKQI